MSIKLANNAVAHLAASLTSTDTTVVIDPAEVGNFPSLSAGEWHPMTLISPVGVIEIVKVTDRAANTATTGITVGNNTGGGGAHNNVQPSIVVAYIIKT